MLSFGMYENRVFSYLQVFPEGCSTSKYGLTRTKRPRELPNDLERKTFQDASKGGFPFTAFELINQSQTHPIVSVNKHFRRRNETLNAEWLNRLNRKCLGSVAK